MSQVWDVAVLGGGVIGLACAFELARKGQKVVVIERDQPGQQASALPLDCSGRLRFRWANRTTSCRSSWTACGDIRSSSPRSSRSAG